MEKFTKVVALMIERSKLHPHPDNPRKDLGDLSELKESIRLHGIMQNLTVIPEDDSYESFKILIGHRRFAASEGILDTLLCVIVENLTEREQIGIMLCENLQRNDLTWYEQGRGFQMMLDLGDTIDDIKEKTGFSEKTIKHRVEIAKLSKSSLENRSWQLSLTDLMTLEKIKDLKKRQEILDRSQSSENLIYRIDQQIREDRYKANLKKAKKICKSLNISEHKGGCARWSSNYETVKRINLQEDKEISEKDFEDLLPELSKHVHTYEESYGTLYVMYKKDTKEEKTTKKEKELQKKFDRIRDIKKQVNEIHEFCCKKYFDLIMEIPSLTIIQLPDMTRLHFMENVELLLTRVQPDYWISPGLYDESAEDFQKKLDRKHPTLVLMAYIVAGLMDDMIIDWGNEKSEEMINYHKELTNLLEPFGFSLPGGQEDQEIIKGTSPLYDELKKLNSEVEKDK